MGGQSFDTIDVLRLEVEDDPTGLVNLVPNPTGELGAWGWRTPVAGTLMLTGGVSTYYLSYYNGSNTGAAFFTTEKMPVVAGQYVAARWEIPGGGVGFYRVRLEWLNAAGAVISSSIQSGYLSSNGPSTQGYAAIVAPALTVAVRLRFDLYSNTSGGNPPAGRSLEFTNVTVAKAATAGALAGLPYIPPVPYLNILGPTHDLKITRDELAVGLLTATVLDATLDPAQADLLRPGRRLRVTTLAPASGRWETLFFGKVSNAQVNYDYKTPGLADAKRARITLTAADNVSAVAAVPRDEGVATITELPYLLEGAGVPWSVNGDGNQVPSATVVARNANASLLDQIAITRDSKRGYAWVDRRGVVNVWDAANMPTASVATFDEDDYTDLSIDYDTERCINTVTIKYLRTNLATGETVEVPYGPYVDQNSIDQWGPRSAEFTIQGITETAPNMAAYAAAVLAANATPVVRVNSVTLAVLDAAEVTYALHDLYDLVTINNTNAGLTQDLRITGIEHTISATPKGGKWITSYAFAADGGAAPPQPTPSPGPGAGAALPDGAALNLTGSWGAAVPGPTTGTAFTCKAGVLRGTATCEGYSAAGGTPIIVQLYIDGVNQGDMRLSAALTPNVHLKLSTLAFAPQVSAGTHYVYLRQTSGVSDNSDFGSFSAVVTPT